jgi:hypothetical protein
MANTKPISYDKFLERVEQLLDSGKITTSQFNHFKSRGIEIIRPLQDFGLRALGRVLPEIVIGSSYNFIERMKVPYQATSFLVANTKSDLTGWYVYKIPEQPRGGLLLLSGGERRFGDNVFASTHRIIFGRKAIMVSAVNLMANKDNIWNWHFFGDHLQENNKSLFDDLLRLETIMKSQKDANGSSNSSPKYYVVIARSESTFKKLEVIENYLQKKISVLNPINGIHVIFLTNKSGFDFASRVLEESDLISYIITGEYFDLYHGMRLLRRNCGIDIMLNDGGRIMSNAVKREGLLGEERLSLEPYPGENIFPSDKYIDPTTVAGFKGLGLDGSEVEGSIRIQSNMIEDEKLATYICPLNEVRVL